MAACHAGPSGHHAVRAGVVAWGPDRTERAPCLHEYFRETRKFDPSISNNNNSNNKKKNKNINEYR